METSAPYSYRTRPLRSAQVAGRSWSPGWPPPRTAAPPRASNDLLSDGLVFWAAVAIVFVVHQTPSAAVLERKIGLLGTWSHELGHCLVAEVLGACSKIKIYEHGGGLTIALLYTAQAKAEDPFTAGMCMAFAIGAATLALLPFMIRSLCSQLIAVSMGLDTVTHGWDYAWIESFKRDGTELASDTANIARILGGSHDFWAAAICVLSGLILVVAFFASTPRDDRRT